MKKEYDFSKMKSRKNPYASKLKEPVTIRLFPLSQIVVLLFFLFFLLSGMRSSTVKIGR